MFLVVETMMHPVQDWLLVKRGIDLAALESTPDSRNKLPCGDMFAEMAAAFIRSQYDAGKSEAVLKSCRSALVSLYMGLNTICGVKNAPALGMHGHFKMEFESAMAGLSGKGVRYVQI